MSRRGFDRFEHQRGDVDTELRTARAETDRYAGLYADVCAKLDAARAEIARLKAKLAASDKAGRRVMKILDHYDRGEFEKLLDYCGTHRLRDGAIWFCSRSCEEHGKHVALPACDSAGPALGKLQMD